MAATYSLYARLTYQYVPAWKEEDHHEYLGPAKQTQPTMLLRKLSEDYESADYRLAVTLPPATLAAAKRVYQGDPKNPRLTFNQWLCRQIGGEFDGGCKCEFDCCGHYQWSGQATRTGRRTFVVHVHGYPNI